MTRTKTAANSHTEIWHLYQLLNRPKAKTPAVEQYVIEKRAAGRVYWLSKLGFSVDPLAALQFTLTEARYRRNVEEDRQPECFFSIASSPQPTANS